MALRSISLFSGAGGLDLGLHLATGGRCRAVVYVEREAYAAACLVARMEEKALDPAPVWSDVSTFDARAWRGAVDLVAGGSPCQDLSVAGKRAGLAGARSGLFYEFVRIADECGASLVFWENVGGAKSALPDVFSEFARVGYRGAACSIRASDVGAPHRRQRLFLLGWRGDGLERLRNVAHCHCHGLEVERCGGLLDRERQALGDYADGRGEAVALSGEPRLEGAGHARDASSGRDGQTPRPTAERGRLLWPPGPDNATGWAAYVAAGGPAPAQPRVRRGSDGVAEGLVESVWADRLRVLGNGVVPQQAAAAFRFLAARIIGENHGHAGVPAPRGADDAEQQRP